MLGDFQKRKLTHLFTRLDANGDNHIDTADLELIVSRVGEVQGPNSSPERLKQLSEQYRVMHQAMVAGADTNQSGGVSLDEWLAYADKIVHDDAMFDQVIGGLTALFHAIIDQDGDGQNESADYAAFLKAIRGDASQADATFKKLDKNGDGKLSLDDLRSGMDDFFRADRQDGPATYFFGAF